MAYKKVPRVAQDQEEEKLPLRKRDVKRQDKCADDKSDFSGFTVKTTKTNKTTGGKALDKHCTVCDKRISGVNWGKHVKKVHNSQKPLFTKYTSHKSKYNISDCSYMSRKALTYYSYGGKTLILMLLLCVHMAGKLLLYAHTAGKSSYLPLIPTSQILLLNF